ncbi:MAG: ABC transporter ATP-binding protein, partial [Pseudomonadota bacterium]
MSAFDLELVQLKKVYPGGTLAVEGFDLQVEKGEFISFVGPSGCGKTTTLRMIAGLEDITSGDLLIRGRNFTRVPAEERPTATIFQNYALFPHMTVRENLAFGLEVRKLPTAEVKRKVDAIIDTLELGDVAGAKERNLSGGQKQRVALARGLVTEPDILLLDEPLGALDANLRKSIQEELKILQRELGLTFVFVTHAQSEALAMGDRVVVMNAGRVEQISPPFELYTRPRTAFVARFIGRNMILDGTVA